MARIRLRYRYPVILLRAMVVTDFKLRYQASVLGYLWTLLKPLAMFTVLYLVFIQLLKFGASVPYNAIYLLFGIVIWGFFAEATTQGLARSSRARTCCARSASRGTSWCCPSARRRSSPSA